MDGIIREAKNEIKRPLSNEDIEKAIPGINIITSEDLYPTMSLKELLGPNNHAAFLYINPNTSVGHWVYIQKLKGKAIEYFDSYSFLPDSKQVNKLRPVLSQIFLNNGIKQVYFNNSHLQNKDRGVNTCGRWAIFRALNRKIPLGTFVENIKHFFTDKRIEPMPDILAYLATRKV